jgi:hypothetical protein
MKTQSLSTRRDHSMKGEKVYSLFKMLEVLDARMAGFMLIRD